MVLVYRVDVRSLAPVHRASVLALVRDAEPALDACLYGVLYQDRGRVLGAALVSPGSDGAHAVGPIAVLEAERNRGIGTELLAVLKEQLPPGVAARFAPPDDHPRRAALVAFVETSGFAEGADGVYEYVAPQRT